MPYLRVVEGIFVACNRPFLFPEKCKMAILSSRIVISIFVLNRDFSKRFLLFSVKREMSML